MNFLRRLFGLGPKPAPAPSTSPGTAKPSAPAAPPVAPPLRTVIISWQEVIDRQSRIAGYCLRPASLQNGVPPTAGAIRDSLLAERVTGLAERRLALIPLSRAQWQDTDFRPLVAAQTHFLIGADEAPDDTGSLIGLIEDIRAGGGRVALGEAALALSDGLASQADLLVLSPGTQLLQAFEQRLRRYRERYPALPLMVDGVSSWAEHRLFLSHGVQYSMGSFAALPDDQESNGKVSQSRLIVIEMLNLLRSQAELSEIAATAKRDPAVVLKLLEMANSPLSGLSRQVVTIEDAIMLLGRDALYRWLALALFRVGNQDGRDETLLVIALCRAYFLESVAGGDRQLAGELFLVGLLSVMDALLGLPMAQVLDKMRLPGAVAAVLLKSEGPYAPYLAMAMAMERCRMSQALMLAQTLGISSERLLAAYSEAMAASTAELAQA